MSPLLRRRPVAVDLPERLASLQEVLDRGGALLDPALRERTRATLARAGERLRLSADVTVVALAGATGSGKSSLFNALAGDAVSQVGVRRPMTSRAHACVWAGDVTDPTGAAAPLLDWLQVDRRSVRAAGEDEQLEGLVLLDLPDFDSTAADHRVEVDRLVRMVDLLVWVVDPQKYADAVLHERYLRPLRSHAEVSLVVLNQVDTLPAGTTADCLQHLRRLLDDDGLGEARILATSAVTGTGMEELRGLLAAAVRARRAAEARIAADVDELAKALSDALGTGAEGRAGAGATQLGAGRRPALVTALAGAAGVEVVAGAVERSWRGRCVRETGLPWTRWTGRLRADPLRRLHLGGGSGPHGRAPDSVVADAVAATVRSSLPSATPVQRSRVDTAIRAAADAASAGLPSPWVASVRAAARSRAEDLADTLDRAVAGTDLGAGSRPLWWRVLGGLQLALAAAVLAGLLWLGVIFGVAWLGLPDLPTVEVGPDVDGAGGNSGLVALPTALVLGGLVAGVLVAALARLGGRIGGRRRRRRAEARLHASIERVADDLVLAPIAAELQACSAVSGALARARRPG